MFLLYNMRSRLVLTFLPRSKHLLISWLQSPSAVILDPAKIKSATVSTVSPSICHEAREFQKNIYFCFIDYAKAFDCVDHNHCGKTMENSERDGNTRPPDLPLEKPVCRSGSNSWNWTWNNRLVPNRKRSMSRLYIVTLLI